MTKLHQFSQIVIKLLNDQLNIFKQKHDERNE